MSLFKITLHKLNLFLPMVIVLSGNTLSNRYQFMNLKQHLTASTASMKKNLSLLFISISFLISPLAQAATLMQIKNQKTLISLEGLDASVGEVYDVVGSSGKSGQIKIIQVKNNKAIAQVLNGSVAVGQKLRTNSSVQAASKSMGKKDIVIRHDLMKISVLGKLMMNTFVTKQADTNNGFPRTETVTMNGTNFGATGALDYPLSTQYTFRGQVGIEAIAIKGTAQYLSCAGKSSTDCNVNINYLVGGGFLRYDFVKSENVVWGAIGGTLKMPISKSSTALKNEDINMANTLGLMFGYDYNFDNKTFIPMTWPWRFIVGPPLIPGLIDPENNIF